jgi:hypothetical protein
MNIFNSRTLLLMIFFFAIAGSTPFAQTTILPGDTALHYNYLKNRNLFHKISWVDKNNQTVGEAVLNLVTRIDSVSIP